LSSAREGKPQIPSVSSTVVMIQSWSITFWGAMVGVIVGFTTAQEGIVGFVFESGTSGKDHFDCTRVGTVVGTFVGACVGIDVGIITEVPVLDVNVAETVFVFSAITVTLVV